MCDIRELYRSSQEWLPEYVRSSYRLSGLLDEPTEAEIAAHRGLLMCRRLATSNVEILAAYICPGSAWRELADDLAEMDSVEAGTKSKVQRAVDDLLLLANSTAVSADELLLSFSRLRPFTGGNGRVGRALWMWRMTRGAGDELHRLQAIRQPAGPHRFHS